MRGKIPLLQAVLNLDGYQILSVDYANNLVRLDATSFTEQFGVTL